MSQNIYYINRHVLSGLPGPCGALAQQHVVLVHAEDLALVLMQSKALSNAKVLAQPLCHAAYRYVLIVLNVSNIVPMAVQLIFKIRDVLQAKLISLQISIDSWDAETNAAFQDLPQFVNYPRALSTDGMKLCLMAIFDWGKNAFETVFTAYTVCYLDFLGDFGTWKKLVTDSANGNVPLFILLKRHPIQNKVGDFFVKI